MDEPNPFTELMERVRSGDEKAAEVLVRRYETTVRVAVRIRLTDSALRRYFDSIDVCQSVLKSFFRRAVAGRCDVHEPVDLVRLLVGMTRKKVARYVRRYRQRQRDYRRLLEDSGHLVKAQTDSRPSPAERAMHRDLIDGVYRQLSRDERQLAEAWASGQGWDEIAARLGGSAEGRRKQLSRALDRVVEGLRSDDDTAP